MNIKPPAGFKLDQPPTPTGGIGTIPPPEGIPIEDKGELTPPHDRPILKPPQGFTLDDTFKTQEKLWTGQLGVKIGGKTIQEHVGDPIKKYWEERTTVPESPPLLSKEFAQGVTENTKNTIYQLWGKMPSGEEIINSLESGEPIPPLVQKEYVSVMKPKPGMGKTLLNLAKDVGMGVADFISWIPTMTTKFIKDPKGTLYNDPVGTYILGHVASGMIGGKAKPVEFKTSERALLKPEPWRRDLRVTPEQIAEQKGIHQQASEAFQADLARIKTELEGPKPTDIPTRKPSSTDISKVSKDPYTEVHSGFDLKEEISRSLQHLKTGDIKGHLPATEKLKVKRIGKSKLSLRLPPEPEPGLPGMDKIVAAIKHFQPMRAEQEALYTKEHAQRMATGISKSEKLSGEAWAETYLGAHKGEMKKVPRSPIRWRLTQEELDGIFQQAKLSPKLTEWERLPVINALTKVFGKEEGKLGLPTESELALLGRVYPKEFVGALKKQWGTWDKVKLGVMEASGIPRAIMSAYDLSFGLRQGSFLAPRFPKIWGKAWVEQWKYLTSQKAFDGLRQEIAARPTYKLMRQGKLALTDIDYTLTAREEAFMSHWAENIPGVRQSARAYTGMANKLRADVFDDFIKYQEKLGLKPKENPRLVRATADFINNATGRGKLKKLESSAVILNNVFFSPRLILSRLKLLNPVYYAKLPKGVRGRALQSLTAYAGTGMSFISMAKLAEKAFPDDIEVGDNPFSADFGKIKIGNTRIDIWGGFQQYVRGATQVIGGKTVSTTTGKVTKTGEGYKPLTRLQLAGRLVEYKFAPVTSFAYDLIRGSNAFGKKIDFADPNLTENPVTSRMIPMVVQDLIELYKDDPTLTPLSALGFFGIGLQTYQQTKKKPTKKKPSKEFWY